MTADADIVLFTRPGCHLCEQAAVMLDELRVDWRAVDIEGDADLEDRYGLVIPVVFLEGTKKELRFPFGKAQLSRFLEDK